MPATCSVELQLSYHSQEVLLLSVCGGASGRLVHGRIDTSTKPICLSQTALGN